MHAESKKLKILYNIRYPNCLSRQAVQTNSLNIRSTTNTIKLHGLLLPEEDEEHWINYIISKLSYLFFFL